MIRAALIGNPNVGKTEIFNRLTGLSQRVGNFPGVTVEKKAGRLLHNGVEMEIVDLPGTYSFSCRAKDETAARDYIVNEKPDVVVDIVDGTNLERNLYLTLLLQEMDVNLVLAVNRWDMAKAREIDIDLDKLSLLLGCPVVSTVAVTGEGLPKLLDAVAAAFDQNDHDGKINAHSECNQDLASDLQFDQQSLLAQMRYEKIAKIVEAIVKRSTEQASTFTDMLDQVFLNKYLGIPIFLMLLWAMFQFAFTVSEPFVVMIEKAFELLGAWSDQAISDPYLASFVYQGIFSGLGSVLVFVPPIFGLFFGLSILEDSGYMARAAFVMDRFMNRLGLHGRSFIPLMIGFGCNVPAIMAARSMDNEKDRMITMLISPLVSCSARLPVYVLIAGAVFGAGYAGSAVFAVYALGIVLAVIMALVFRKTLFKGEPSPFVLEMPSYVVPDLRSALYHMWGRGKSFLKRAGTIVFGATLVIWYLSVHPWQATNGGQLIAESYIATIGHLIEPVFLPFGWNWMAGVALLFGLLAKEVVVGTYGVLLSAGESDLGEALVGAGIFTPLTGFAFMAFVLIYVPCVAVIGTIAKETESYFWPLFMLGLQTLLAFLVAGIIIGAGRLLGYS